MKIFLIGFMGAGKSTIGKYAARHNEIEFLDLDAFIEEAAGMSVREIFGKLGEEVFRKMERAALEEVCEKPGTFLVSCGGGTPCFFGNMDLMNASGATVYLDLSAARLTDRLRNSKSKRPLIERLEGDLQVYVHKKLMQRAEHYGKAQYIVPEKEANKKDIRDLVERLIAEENA